MVILAYLHTTQRILHFHILKAKGATESVATPNVFVTYQYTTHLFSSWLKHFEKLWFFWSNLKNGHFSVFTYYTANFTLPYFESERSYGVSRYAKRVCDIPIYYTPLFKLIEALWKIVIFLKQLEKWSFYYTAYLHTTQRILHFHILKAKGATESVATPNVFVTYQYTTHLFSSWLKHFEKLWFFWSNLKMVILAYLHYIVTFYTSIFWKSERSYGVSRYAKRVCDIPIYYTPLFKLIEALWKIVIFLKQLEKWSF